VRNAALLIITSPQKIEFLPFTTMTFIAILKKQNEHEVKDIYSLLDANLAG
jgi:hypothetical protein